MKLNEFDCIVVGGGHAGVEAAHAAARIGAETCLITLGADTIAKMSCNPAIGGLGKGQIAREIDALGGLMGLAIDATGIQFRLLNRSKGPAVRAPRAQADKYQYQDFMRARLDHTPNLTIVEAMATEILTDGTHVRGVRCRDGAVYHARAMILTTGTFLRGLMHVGAEQLPGGRLGEPAATELSESLERIGLERQRLKTGTPVRLKASTCALDELEIHHGDTEPVAFSFMTDRLDRPEVPCWITYTNEAIHQLIRENLDRAPLYTGQIQSAGPRYCPSIETKIERFADKTRHQVFLEPEDEACTTIYCNGISTSLPRDVQERMLRLMPRTESAHIVHYAYAIEYDYCPPVQLRPSLETRKIAGLFLAGQINGTSGYEEAAAQGLVAGVNAARLLQGAEPLVLGRDQAYIGVMIDDLLTRGIDEPYRMFTSRAEHRLALRSDNADRRLTEIGQTVGLVDSTRYDRFRKKVSGIETLRQYLQTTRLAGESLWGTLRKPNNDLAENLATMPEIESAAYGRDVLEAVAIDAKYEGYLAKQQRTVALQRSLDSKRIPAGLDYAAVEHLRVEAREKLSAFQPATLGHASRISGITPADITVIQVHLKKHYGSGSPRATRRES
jgi:tRNA uridine 5-carboxymethylaminomethyl modification enzyme